MGWPDVYNVRNTFLSIEQYIPIELRSSQDVIAKLKVIIRDTMLLTPQASKSLRAIGDLVGYPKVELDPDPLVHKQLLERMDVMLKQ